MSDPTPTSHQAATPNFPRPAWVDVFDLLDVLLKDCADNGHSGCWGELEIGILLWFSDFRRYTGINPTDFLHTRGVGYAVDMRKQDAKARQLIDLEGKERLSTRLWNQLRRRVPLLDEARSNHAASTDGATGHEPPAAAPQAKVNAPSSEPGGDGGHGRYQLEESQNTTWLIWDEGGALRKNAVSNAQFGLLEAMRRAERRPKEDVLHELKIANEQDYDALQLRLNHKLGTRAAPFHFRVISKEICVVRGVYAPKKGRQKKRQSGRRMRQKSRQ
jgi:hypothetical protein